MWPTDQSDGAGAPDAIPVIETATVLVEDRGGAILLHRRDDDRLWALPGRTKEPGEGIEETAMRAVGQEVGLGIRLTGLVGIYTDPEHIGAGDDGDIREVLTICFAAAPAEGAVTVGEGRCNLALVSPDQLAEYPMHPTTRRCIDDHLRHTRTFGQGS